MAKARRLRHPKAVSVPQNPTGSKAKNLARSKSKHNRNKAEKEADGLADLEREVNDSRQQGAR